jgi:hypothetical protein
MDQPKLADRASIFNPSPSAIGQDREINSVRQSAACTRQARRLLSQSAISCIAAADELDDRERHT